MLTSLSMDNDELRDWCRMHCDFDNRDRLKAAASSHWRAHWEGARHRETWEAFRDVNCNQHSSPTLTADNITDLDETDAKMDEISNDEYWEESDYLSEDSGDSKEGTSKSSFASAPFLDREGSQSDSESDEEEERFILLLKMAWWRVYPHRNGSRLKALRIPHCGLGCTELAG